MVDVSYTHGFYRELTPSYLGFAALVQGQSVPGLRAEPLAYCELGCGQGFSTNLLAGANPHIQFYATDFNPTHIVGARDLARAAQLDNVRFFDDSFAEFVDNPSLPVFDIVALHGIYSWISPENRRFIVQFIRRKLKPGGLVYISYNTMPGWAPIMPLRHLLAEHAAARGPKPITTKIDDAIAFAERLVAVKSRFFKDNPKAGGRLERMKSQSRAYLAHEYFNRDLTPFYFSELAQELSEAKLTWAGSAHVLDSVDAINLTTEQREVLGEIDDPVLRQTVRDHIVDQQFRRDIFIKGSKPLSRIGGREEWLNARFALSARASDIPRTMRGNLGEMKLDLGIYDPLLAALDATPRTLRDLFEESTIAKVGQAKVQQALTFLVGEGHCHPCLPAAGEPERRALAEGFNLAVAESAREGDTYSSFASPVTGGGIRVNRMNQLIWLAKRQNAPDVPQYIWTVLQRVGQRVMKEGKPLSTAAENLAELRTMVATYERDVEPILVNVGVS